MSVEWDKTKRQFERGGKPIPPSAVRQFVLDTVESAKSRMDSIAKGYTTHRNTAEFYTSMKDEIRNMHSALAMIAQGGREQMDAKAWGAVGNQIKSEMSYLRGFERDIANGNQSDAQILARAIQYANAGVVTYESAIFAREKEAGILYVQWTLEEGNVEHCGGCIEAEGVHPIDDAPEYGSHECGAGCRCLVEYLDSEDVAEAA